VRNVVLFALAISLVAAAVCLAREVRLRRALQRLLRFLLSRWRNHEPSDRDRSPNDLDDRRLR
jgi:hypothetical protein